ncbi:hypothetical protein [Streptomyces sp. NRRL S-1813]|nr:hypothetical protein [Streptomyces sp. NRRL S-1813]
METGTATPPTVTEGQYRSLPKIWKAVPPVAGPDEGVIRIAVGQAGG